MIPIKNGWILESIGTTISLGFATDSTPCCQQVSTMEYCGRSNVEISTVWTPANGIL